MKTVSKRRYYGRIFYFIVIFFSLSVYVFLQHNFLIIDAMERIWEAERNVEVDSATRAEEEWRAKWDAAEEEWRAKWDAAAEEWRAKWDAAAEAEAKWLRDNCTPNHNQH
jgi:uncharacterized membrane protein